MPSALLEPRDRIAQPALGRFRIHARGLADLGHGKPAFNIEQEGAALFLRQALERGGEPLACLAREDRVERFPGGLIGGGCDRIVIQ